MQKDFASDAVKWEDTEGTSVFIVLAFYSWLQVASGCFKMLQELPHLPPSLCHWNCISKLVVLQALGINSLARSLGCNQPMVLPQAETKGAWWNQWNSIKLWCQGIPSNNVPTCFNRSQATLQKRTEHRPLFCQTLLAFGVIESLSIGWVFPKAPSYPTKNHTQNMNQSHAF